MICTYKDHGADAIEHGTLVHIYQGVGAGNARIPMPKAIVIVEGRFKDYELHQLEIDKGYGI